MLYQVITIQDDDTSMPMKADSIFWIASQTQVITAVAVLMPNDGRKISLDDPVEKHVAERVFNSLGMKDTTF
jgi:CubicO group peptidase (beta-lactamase class C family)